MVTRAAPAREFTFRATHFGPRHRNPLCILKFMREVTAAAVVLRAARAVVAAAAAVLTAAAAVVTAAAAVAILIPPSPVAEYPALTFPRGLS